jgi:polysaccharide biosynthesis/export protein
MLRLTRHVITALTLGAAATAVQAQTTAYQPNPTNPATNVSAQQKEAAAPANQDANYVIGPQDVLNISVWKEAELTQSVPVRPDGKISMPLLNDVQAAGLTPSQLANEITAGLKKFVTDPQVTVIVSQINSQRIYVLGEVSRAGAYPLLPGMTILQGLSSAGGFTQFANTKKIYMLRTESGKQERYPFNYKDVIAGKHAEENLPLKAGDTIVVP